MKLKLSLTAIYLTGWFPTSSYASTSSSSSSSLLSEVSISTFNKYRRRLTEQTMSPNLKAMEYAVRGKVVVAADRIDSDLTNPKSKKTYPFTKILKLNIGNPHSVGQKPLSWPRQVMALVDLPDELGILHESVHNLFPADAIERAKLIKKAFGDSGTGAYTHSQGPFMFRQEICRFIEQRDALPLNSCDPECIFMTNGASAGITMILTALIANKDCGVMIPIPQYPIYSATIDLLGGNKVGYYLDEKNGWDLNLEELERSLSDAKSRGINVNSFVLINPGNPTGQVLSRKTVQEIVKFCSRHNLVLLADEVYQENVYDENAEFYSCLKAAHETKVLSQDESIELVSFHSTSKGLYGECGRRGGYMHLVGIDPKVRDEIYKMASSGLCSNTNGQMMTSLMVNEPKPGDVSYESHMTEKQTIYNNLKRRSKIVSDGFNSIPGFSCQLAQGAMYIFPSMEMPKGAIAASEMRGITPDTLFAVSLLEKTGICVVPASGFGQEEGRYGFRSTFLPSDEELLNVIEQVRQHYEEFCSKFAV